MSNQIKNFIDIVKKIKMTEEENASVRAKVATFAKKHSMDTTPLQFRVPSPYFSRFSFVYVSKVVGFAMLFVMLGVGGLSYSSASALPGDFLYGVKITKEKIEESFVATTPAKKIALKQKRIETRFKEVETLIKEKKITPENKSIAEAKILEEKIEIGNNLEELNKENPQVAIDAKIVLDASILEHQEKIAILIEESNTGLATTDGINNETDFNEGDNTDIATTPGPDIMMMSTMIADESVTTSTPSTIDPAVDPSVPQDLEIAPETGTLPVTPPTDPINKETPKTE